MNIKAKWCDVIKLKLKSDQKKKKKPFEIGIREKMKNIYNYT